MTSDTSPNGSPFADITPHTWAAELLAADEQGNLDILQRVASDEEWDEITSTGVKLNFYPDDTRRAKITESLGGEDELNRVQAELAAAQTVLEQFEVIKRLEPVKRAGMMALAAMELAGGTE